MSARPSKRQRPAVERYLDLEAAVDNVEDEDVDDDEDHAFIDQSVLDDDEGEYHEHAALLRQILIQEFQANEDPDNELSEGEGEGDKPHEEGVGQDAELSELRALIPNDDSRAACLPGEDDTLYKIGCKVSPPKIHLYIIYIMNIKIGLEEATAFRIFALATAVTFPVPLAKAVIANPHLPGRIYIEPYKTNSQIIQDAQSGSDVSEDDRRRLHYKAFADIERLARRMPALRPLSI